MDFDATSGSLDALLQEVSERQPASPLPEFELDVSNGGHNWSVILSNYGGNSLCTGSSGKAVATRKWFCCAVSRDRHVPASHGSVPSSSHQNSTNSSSEN